MAAAAVPQIGYPIKLNRNGTVTFKARKLENHLIEQLNYNQTEASTLVDEITRLVRANNKSVLLAAAVWRKAPHLVNVMLQSVDPSERLRLIQIQAGGVDGLYNIAAYHLETFRQILESVISDDERLQLPAWDRLSLKHSQNLCQASMQLLQMEDSTTLKNSAT